MPPRPAPILVVEAHCDVRTAIEMALESAGYEVCVAGGVSEALGVLEDLGRPGLVLLDEALPEAECVRLIQRVRQAPAMGPVPIVLLSMDGTGHLEGVQALLRKPFTLDRLYAVVEEHCEVRDVPRIRRTSPVRGPEPLAEGREAPVLRLGAVRM